ncbi:MAG: glycosyltransferase [Desulfobacter sp.]
MNSEAGKTVKELPANAHVAIGICTFRRPQLLEKTLLSLKGMRIPGGCRICVIVADNDADRSAEPLVNRVGPALGVPVHYHAEPRPGIPFARNRVLAAAKDLDTDALIFIDDDEYVDENWLVHLWSCYRKSDADALMGFVRTLYPENTPGWIVRGTFYQRDKVGNKKASTLFQALASVVVAPKWNGKSPRATGERMNFGRTCNCLINFKKLIVEQDLSFDEDFGLQGGSDAEFFMRVIKKGGVIRWVEEAVVYEPLALDRMSLAYFIRRNFKTRNYAHEDQRGVKRRVKMVLRGVLIGAGGLASFPVNLFRGRFYLVQSIRLVVIATGLLLSAAGIFIKWEEYGR